MRTRLLVLYYRIWRWGVCIRYARGRQSRTICPTVSSDPGAGRVCGIHSIAAMLNTPRTPIPSQSRAVPWMLPGLAYSTVHTARRQRSQSRSACTPTRARRPCRRSGAVGEDASRGACVGMGPSCMHWCTRRGRGRRCVARRMTRLIHDSVQQAGIGPGLHAGAACDPKHRHPGPTACRCV